MKKILAFLLIFSLVISGIPAFTQSALAAKPEVPQEDVIIDEDFNGAVFDLTKDAAITQVDRPARTEEGDKALLFPAAAPWKYLRGDITGAESDVVTVEADILVNSKTTQIRIPYIYFDNSSTAAVYLSIVNTSASVAYHVDGVLTRQYKAITLGEWVKVTIECNTVTDTFSVWVNGVPFVTNLTYFNNVNVSKISRIEFTGTTAGDPEFYVDNVKVYKGNAVFPIKEETKAVGDYLAKSVVMKKDSNISYKTGFRTTIEAAPFMQGDVLMLPLDEVAKGFYADSGLDALTDTQYISLHGNDIRVTAGANYIAKNGSEVSIVTPTVLTGGIMYADLATIEEMLDRDTLYDTSTELAIIAQREMLPEGEDRASVLSELVSLYGETLLPPADIYVDADAEHGGSGIIDSPYATFAEAQARVRALLAAGNTGNITVYLREGTYYLDNPITLGAQDSHGGNYTVTYKNYNDERVVIDGGKRLTGWTPYANGIYYTTIEPGMNPQTLYEDGNRVTIARYPNEGYNRVIMSEDTPKSKFYFKEGDIPVVANPTELRFYIWPGGVGGYQNWSMMLKILFLKGLK